MHSARLFFCLRAQTSIQFVQWCDLLRKHRACSLGLSFAVMQCCVSPALYHRPCIDFLLSFRAIRIVLLCSVSSFVEFPPFQLRCAVCTRCTCRPTKVAPATTNRYKLQVASSNKQYQRMKASLQTMLLVFFFSFLERIEFCCATEVVIQAVTLVSSHDSCLLVLKNRMSTKRCPSHRIRLHNRA